MKKTAMQQLIEIIDITIKHAENEITNNVKKTTFDELSAMIATIDLLKTIREGAQTLTFTKENEQLLTAYKEGWQACEKLFFNNNKIIN